MNELIQILLVVLLVAIGNPVAIWFWTIRYFEGKWPFKGKKDITDRF